MTIRFEIVLLHISQLYESACLRRDANNAQSMLSSIYEVMYELQNRTIHIVFQDKQAWLLPTR